MENRKKEPEDYVVYGTPLEPFEDADDVASRKPIRIEDQEVRDEHGRRRFHGAFTGGFSAGYYNTVDTKEGWRPSEFKSSRGDRQKKEQKPEDYMDEEDLGAFGIAPQVLRAKDDYGESHVSRRRQKTVFAQTGTIPGLPALHSILHPVKETIGVRLLRAMGWKPHQGVGERLTKKEKRQRRKKHEELTMFGCSLPPGVKQQTSDGECSGDESDDQLYAPDDVPAFVVHPKNNLFGLGYTGLMPNRNTATTSKSGFVLFEPTLKLTDRNKKLQIAGQAFGVGAFENEDEDIYSKDDMSQYDFVLGGAPEKKKSSKMLALPPTDILEGFVRATKPCAVQHRYPPPIIPKDFVPIHRSQQSRFDVKPLTDAEIKGLGRHDLNAFQRSAILDEVLDMPLGSQSTLNEASSDNVAQQPTKMTPAEVVAQALVQIRKNIEAQKGKSLQAVQETEQIAKVTQTTVAVAVDPDREAKVARLKAFVDSSRTTSTFQPFAKDAEKQYRFEAYCTLSKHKRLEEFHLLQPDSMTTWEREREETEFERSLTLYRPLTTTMQNRFTSGGHVEENIEGGLVAQVETFLQQATVEIKKEPAEKDPAKRAARRKQFGPLTRKRSQWKPDRLLCIRFNVPNPFPNAGETQESGKFSTKAGAKFSIFDVLNVVPQASSNFVSSGYENVTPGPVHGPDNKASELEWDKAEKGELQEKSEADLVPEIGPVEEKKDDTEEEEAPYERPSIDIFKAIFADTDSEEEEEEETNEESKESEKVTSEPSSKKEEAKSVVKEDEMEEDVYGPVLPSNSETTSTKVSVVNFGNSTVPDNQDEWVEKDKVKKEKKKEKKKSKKKKEKKNKKRKRRHSDATSSSSDDEVVDKKLLKKLVALKKQQKL